uniref:Uncharacterized protein n=1 Tax=Lepeophtheirus salmonis TaxID=72036 RepID=A0A0K2V106_LEPSM
MGVFFYIPNIQMLAPQLTITGF